MSSLWTNEPWTESLRQAAEVRKHKHIAGSGLFTGIDDTKKNIE